MKKVSAVEKKEREKKRLQRKGQKKQFQKDKTAAIEREVKNNARRKNPLPVSEIELQRPTKKGLKTVRVLAKKKSAPKQPPEQFPDYKEEDWKALFNACKQPKTQYKYGLLLRELTTLEGLPSAGKQGTWILLPVGALLLKREPGKTANMQDLKEKPLRLGFYVLSYMEPLTPETAMRRQKLRAVRQKRAELRGTRIPGPVAVPNEGRAFRDGGRLVLSMNTQFIKHSRRKLQNMALTAKGLWVGEFSAMGLTAAINRKTFEMQQISSPVWVDVGTLIRWHKEAKLTLYNALVTSGMKAGDAKKYVELNVNQWKRQKGL